MMENDDKLLTSFFAEHRQEISHVTPPAGASQTTGPQYFFRTLCFDGARTPSRYAILGVHAALQPFVPPLRQRLPGGPRRGGHAAG